MSICERFPPVPDHPEECEMLLSMVKGVLGEERVDYVSGPFMGGPRFIQWFRIEGQFLRDNPSNYQLQLESNVVPANRDAILAFARSARKRNVLVIEPATLRSPKLTQNDYWYLWCEVIRQSVKRVHLLEGWEYSKGCVCEFWAAITCKVDVVTQDGLKIDRMTGARSIAHAIHEIELLKINARLFRDVASKLAADQAK